MAVDVNNIKISYPSRKYTESNETNLQHSDLENRIKILEQKLNDIELMQNDKDNIKIGEVYDEAHKKIIDNCKGNIWILKNLIQKQNADDKILYIAAYNCLCQMKGGWIGYASIWGSVPTLPHGYLGIFVSNGAKIGKHATIFQNVTIGSNTLKDSRRNGSPTIGDNVYIGAGATIIGNCNIGNNVRIGAGCSVAIDIPDNSVVVSQKPVIIHKDNMDNRFYNWQNGKYGYVEDGVFHPLDNS